MSDSRVNLLALAAGLVFGFVLGFSQMAQPEVVLSFLQLRDLGLVFVMLGAAGVVAVAVAVLSRTDRRAPLTGSAYGRRLRDLDSQVLLGGGMFGVGWGISGICPGAAYAGFVVDNYVILYGVAGMFLGAYVQRVYPSVDLADEVAAGD